MSSPSLARLAFPLILALGLLALHGCSDNTPGTQDDVLTPDAEDVDTPPDDATSDEPDAGDRPELPPSPDTRDDANVPPPPDTNPPEIPSFEDPPVILSVTPSRGPANGGTLVQVIGERFSSGTRVYLNDVEQLDTDLYDTQELWFFTEAGTPGPATLRIINDAGVAQRSDAFVYDPQPVIHALDPPEGPETGGNPVLLRGEGLSETARVFFGDLEATIIDTYAEGLEVVAPPGSARTRVDVEVLVDEVRLRHPEAYHYRTALTVTGVGPREVAADTGGRVLLLARGLAPECTITLGALPLPLEKSADGTFWLQAPPGEPGASASLGVDCGPLGGARVDDAITWVEPPATSTALERIWPAHGDPEGGTLVTLHGRNLPTSASTSVRIGGVEVNVVERTSTRMLVTAPALSPGTWDVRVQYGTTVLRLTDAWNVRPRPRFDRLVPALGPAEQSWLSDVQGQLMDPVQAWVVDGRVIESSRQSAHNQRLTVPPGTPGSANVQAILDNGSWAATGLALRRRGVPSLDQFHPVAGPTAGGNSVVIYGSGFDDACQATVNGEPIDTTRIGDARLRFVMPPSDGPEAILGVTDCEAAGTLDAPYRFYSGLRSPGGVGGGPLRGLMTVNVREQGTLAPVEGATVQVGVRAPRAWTGITDAEGRAVFEHEDLVGPMTVTAYAPGRSVESYVDVDASEVTLLIWPLPSPPCDPDDPACQPPPTPPPGRISGELRGLDKQRVLPPGYILQARIETTRRSSGWTNPAAGQGGILLEDGSFSVTSRLGDVALIARCGYASLETGQFTTTAIGVRRGVILRPDMNEAELDIECNIPLSESLTVKLDGAPEIVADPTVPGAYPTVYEAQVLFDFGTEGVWETFPPIVGTDTLLTGGQFPPLTGPLSDVVFHVEAGAYPAIGIYPSSTAYVRGVQRYSEVVRLPTLMPVPRFTRPTSDDRVLRGGYIEWSLDETLAQPDFFYVTINADNAGFSRWAIFVPGDYRAFHLTEFLVGAGVPIPALPALSLRVFIRAVDLESLQWGDFSRNILDTRRWRSSSVSYEVLPILEAVPTPVED